MQPTLDDLPQSDLPEMNLEAQFASPRATSARLVSIGAVIAFCAVLLWGQLVPLAQQALAQWRASPHGPRAYLHTNITFGTFVVNGDAIANHGAQVVAMHPGHNTITLEAAPFRTVSCVISFPAIPGDTCQVMAPHTLNNVYPGLAPASPDVTLLFPLTLDDLPPQAQIAAQAAIAATIAHAAAGVHVTVPVGDYFASGFDAKRNVPIGRRATQPLVMTAQAQMRDPHIPWQSGCWHAYCDDAVLRIADARRIPAGEWVYTARYQLLWRFATLDGHVVSTIPADGQSGFMLTTMWLNIDAAKGWHASVAPPPLSFRANFPFIAPLGDTCSSGQSLAYAATSTAPYISPSADVHQDAGPRGCAFAVNAPEFVFGKPTDFGQGLLLWRFGMLLTADERTHSVYHALFPSAPPDEILAVTG